MPLESKRLAALLLTGADEIAWRQAVEVDNILQKKTSATARRQATLIRKRLTTLDKEAWEMLVSREQEVVLQLLLVAAIRHSRLLGDFLRGIYVSRQLRLERSLVAHDWHDFLEECAHLDHAVTSWSESTRAKLFQVIVRILVESKYLDNARRMCLTPRSLHPDVRRYLFDRKDTPMINCLERAS